MTSSQYPSRSIATVGLFHSCQVPKIVLGGLHSSISRYAVGQALLSWSKLGLERMGRSGFPSGIAQRLIIRICVLLLATTTADRERTSNPGSDAWRTLARVAYRVEQPCLPTPGPDPSSTLVRGCHWLRACESRPADCRCSAARCALSSLSHWLSHKPDVHCAHRPAILTGPKAGNAAQMDRPLDSSGRGGIDHTYRPHGDGETSWPWSLVGPPAHS